MSKFEFEIIEEFGVLSTSASGWTRELNLISWNGRAPKFDIRDWSPDHEKMGRGLTFTNEELQGLKDVLEDIKL